MDCWLKNILCTETIVSNTETKKVMLVKENIQGAQEITEMYCNTDDMRKLFLQQDIIPYSNVDFTGLSLGEKTDVKFVHNLSPCKTSTGFKLTSFAVLKAIAYSGAFLIVLTDNTGQSNPIIVKANNLRFFENGADIHLAYVYNNKTYYKLIGSFKSGKMIWEDFKVLIRKSDIKNIPEDVIILKESTTQYFGPNRLDVYDICTIRLDKLPNVTCDPEYLHYVRPLLVTNYTKLLFLRTLLTALDVTNVLHHRREELHYAPQNYWVHIPDSQALLKLRQPAKQYTEYAVYLNKLKTGLNTLISEPDIHTLSDVKFTLCSLGLLDEAFINKNRCILDTIGYSDMCDLMKRHDIFVSTFHPTSLVDYVRQWVNLVVWVGWYTSTREECLKLQQVLLNKVLRVNVDIYKDRYLAEEFQLFSYGEYVDDIGLGNIILYR